MKCPYCGDQDSKVIDSRHSEDGASIRRRRECLACQKRFTTYETVESLPIIVVKKDGSRQSFDRTKTPQRHGPCLRKAPGLHGGNGSRCHGH